MNKSTSRILSVFVLAALLILGLKVLRSPNKTAVMKAPVPSQAESSSEPEKISVNSETDTAKKSTDQSASSSSESSPATKKAILTQILSSKNDNDPRLDTDFNNLSDADKAELRAYYQELPKEDRNELGTIIFLLGRNLKSPEDFHFMNQVMNEPVCLSLSDCNKATAEPTDPNEMHGSVADVTLAYPKIVALKSLENYLREHKDDNFHDDIEGIVRSALNSSEPRIAKQARDLYRAYYGKKL